MKLGALFLGFSLAATCHPDGAARPEARAAITPTVSMSGKAAAALAQAPASALPASSAAPGMEGAQDPGCPGGYTCDPGAERHEPSESLPAISEIFIQKQAHKLHLVAGEKRIVRSYSVALGSGGLGQKRVEGDRVTPIGTYSITGRYPSRWHTYLAISFPNNEDIARFEGLAARGEVNRRLGPGSAIAIHGHRRDQQDGTHKQWDWTLGCVALDNNEIDEIAAAAPVGTRIVIAE